MESGYWQHLTTTDFPPADVERAVAVLPVSAVEQHGPHLPLATDALINEGIISRLLEGDIEGARVMVLPALDVGDSLEHTRFPGTLSIDSRALLEAWLEVGRSVARAGVRKLVVFNSHGGQVPLVDLAAVHLRATERLLVARVHSFRLGLPDGLFAVDELAHGVHGGEVETSLMLHLRPELVRLEALDDFASLGARWAREGRTLGVEKPAGIGWMAQDLNRVGVCGNAAGADAGRGALALEHMVGGLRRVIAELAATPLSTLVD